MPENPCVRFSLWKKSIVLSISSLYADHPVPFASIDSKLSLIYYSSIKIVRKEQKVFLEDSYDRAKAVLSNKECLINSDEGQDESSYRKRAETS